MIVFLRSLGNSEIPSNLVFFCWIQISAWQIEKKIVSCQRSCDGAEGQQSSRTCFFHLRALLGAIFFAQHIVRRLPRLFGTRSRSRYLPLAWLCIVHYKSRDLHRFQPNLQGCFYSTAQMQVLQVTRKTFIFCMLPLARSSHNKPPLFLNSNLFLPPTVLGQIPKRDFLHPPWFLCSQLLSNSLNS